LEGKEFPVLTKKQDVPYIKMGVESHSGKTAQWVIGEETCSLLNDVFTIALFMG
jgi:hypothetical protein